MDGRVVVVFTWVAPYACGAEPVELMDPVEILKKADAAARAVNAVQYDVIVEELGTPPPCVRIGTIEARFIVVADGNNPIPRFRADATVTPPDAREAQRISGGGDGESYFIVDHRGKFVYEDIDPSVMGPSAGVFLKAGMAEFLSPTPFTDEINGKTQYLIGSSEIDGEACYDVGVVYQRVNAPEVVWSFSKRDFLPRRRVDLFRGSSGTTGKISKTVRNLVVNAKIHATTFKLELPEGYAKTDDFAPDFLASEPAVTPAAADDDR
jgi:hypothetical protein